MDITEFRTEFVVTGCTTNIWLGWALFKMMDEFDDGLGWLLIIMFGDRVEIGVTTGMIFALENTNVVAGLVVAAILYTLFLCLSGFWGLLFSGLVVAFSNKQICALKSNQTL